MEAWDDPVLTRAWVDGYTSVNPRTWLFSISNAMGCPPDIQQTAVARRCVAPWTQEDVWYVSWGAASALPLPEIYRQNGNNSKQWAAIVLYSFLAHSTLGTVLVPGTLAEWQACQQVHCPAGIDIMPAEGWKQLYNTLNADVRTAQKMTWSTDIKQLRTMADVN
jgi:hypothetical protein